MRMFRFSHSIPLEDLRILHLMSRLRIAYLAQRCSH